MILLLFLHVPYHQLRFDWLLLFREGTGDKCQCDTQNIKRKELVNMTKIGE